MLFTEFSSNRGSTRLAAVTGELGDLFESPDRWSGRPVSGLSIDTDGSTSLLLECLEDNSKLDPIGTDLESLMADISGPKIGYDKTEMLDYKIKWKWNYLKYDWLNQLKLNIKKYKVDPLYIVW